MRFKKVEDILKKRKKKKEAKNSNFNQYKKKCFIGSWTNEKKCQNKWVKCKEVYFEENVHSLFLSFVVKIVTIFSPRIW